MMENSIERKVFDEWFNNKYVWCNTLEKAQTFLNYADFVGCVWSMGNSLLKNDYFEAYGKNTCYFVENGFLRVGDKRRYKCIKITNRLWKKFIKEVEKERENHLKELFEKQKVLKVYGCEYTEKLPYYELPKDFTVKVNVKETITLNKTLPIYIGYKGRKTTLVWSDKTTTTAVASEKEKKVDYDFGFLMAYYKRVQLQTGGNPNQTQKWVENNVYGLPPSQRKAYLLAIFDEYCGLSIRKRNSFLEEYVTSKNRETDKDVTLKVSEKYL